MKVEPLFNQLYNVVSRMMPLSQREWDVFAESFVYRAVPKKFRIVSVGDISREAYFINKGAARLFFEKEGEEVSANFMFENNFVASLESFCYRYQAVRL